MRSVLLHLSLIPHVGPIVVKRLMRGLEIRKRALDALYHMDSHDLALLGLSAAQADLVFAGLRDMRVLEEEQQIIARHAVTLVTLHDPEYPQLLREIHAPPPVLYVQGSLQALASERMVAVVGSRQANTYGRSAVETLLNPALQQGWTIVSGGARGIDAAAHHMALKQGGRTIAILGSGLLCPYPRENIPLFQALAAQGGAVISPFPLRTAATPGNFPARNRIIAGLSRACVVVQAAEKSGALITAAYALQEGRDVGVVPGSIFDPLSAGCHRLLREGATPLTGPDDVSVFLGSEERPAAKNMPLAALVADNDPLLAACRGQERAFDELLITLGYSADELHNRLWELQLEGKVGQTITGLWQAI